MDFRLAFRSLLAEPRFTWPAIFVLAMGIGLATALFSVVDAVLLRPLRLVQPDTLVSVWTRWRPSGHLGQVSGPDFHDWHDQSTVFEQLSFFAADETSVTVKGRGTYASVAGIGPGYLEALRLDAAGDRAVIAASFADRTFGKESRPIGQTLTVEGKIFEIAAVVPDEHCYPLHTGVFVPMAVFGETTSRTAHNYRVLGRLKPGVSLAKAQSEMDTIGARLAAQYPAEDAKKQVAVVPLRDYLTRNVQRMLWVLLGAVCLVQLIACANVANLLLARAALRRREMAVRASLGATGARLLLQPVLESLILATAGGAGGLLLAVWGIAALKTFGPAGLPRLDEVQPDWRVVLFAAGTALLSSLLAALTPALLALRVNLNDCLKQGSRTATRAGSGAMRGALVVAQIGLAVTLATGAGLLLRSLSALDRTELGFRPEGRLVASTVAPRDKSGPFYHELRAKVLEIPGVSGAGSVWGLPGSVRSNGVYEVQGLTKSEELNALFTVAAPGYFEAMGIPLRAGRDFSDQDGESSPMVAMVNQAFVDRTFGKTDPIGRRIRCGLDRPEWMDIVGVTADVRQYGHAQAPLPEIYMPYRQHPGPASAMDLVVSTSLPPESLTGAVSKAIRLLDSEVPVKFQTLDGVLGEGTAQPRFEGRLLGAFAVLACLLAAAGIYALMSYVASGRTREIGVRMAFGAGTGDVLRLLMSQGIRLAAIGAACGMFGAWIAGRSLEGALFGVTRTDPATFVAGAVVTALIAIAACYLPAIRAARISPVVALRDE